MSKNLPSTHSWAIVGFNVKELRWERIFEGSTESDVMVLLKKEFHRQHGTFKDWNKFILLKSTTTTAPECEIQINLLEEKLPLPADFSIDTHAIQTVKSPDVYLSRAVMEQLQQQSYMQQLSNIYNNSYANLANAHGPNPYILPAGLQGSTLP